MLDGRSELAAGDCGVLVERRGSGVGRVVAGCLCRRNREAHAHEQAVIIDLLYRGKVWPAVELGHARVAAVAVALTSMAAISIFTG